MSYQRGKKAVIINEVMLGRKPSGGIDRSIVALVVEPSSRMRDFDDQYLKLYRKMMHLLGLSHAQSYRERFTRFYILSFVTMYSIPTQLCHLLVMELELQSIVTLLQTFIPAICFMILYVNVIIHYGTVLSLHSYMEQDWKELKDETELKIMKKYAYQSNLFTIVCGVLFFMFFVLNILPYIVRKIVSSSKATTNDYVPIFACFAYYLDSESYYFLILIHDAVIIGGVLTVALAVYTAYFCFIQHVCAYLTIIKRQLHDTFVDCTPMSIVPVEQMDLSCWIIGVIQRLARVRRFMSLINTLSEKCYLAEILLAFFLLSTDFICLFQLPTMLEKKETRKDAFMFTIFMFTTLFPIYVNCYVGQRLLDYSTDVYEEACLIPFHEISLKTQKLLLTMLTLNGKPFAISIGKVFVSSHEFFSDLLRMALSFSMVVYSMQKI